MKKQRKIYSDKFRKRNKKRLISLLLSCIVVMAILPGISAEAEYKMLSIGSTTDYTGEEEYATAEEPIDEEEIAAEESTVEEETAAEESISKEEIVAEESTGEEEDAAEKVAEDVVTEESQVEENTADSADSQGVTRDATASVDTWQEFIDALADTSVSTIVLEDNITRPDTSASSVLGSINRDLTIYGDGNKIDFGSATADTAALKLAAVESETTLTLDNVILTKGATNFPMFYQVNDAASTNWKIVLNNDVKADTTNNKSGLVYAKNASVTVKGTGNEFITTMSASGSTRHIFYVTNFEMTANAELSLESKGNNGYTVLAIQNNGTVKLGEYSSLNILNEGTTVATTSSLNASNGIYGTISEFYMAKESKLDIMAVCYGYGTYADNTFEMVDGAVFNAETTRYSPLFFGHYASPTSYTSTIIIQGEGTQLNSVLQDSGAASTTYSRNAAFEVVGHNSTITLTDGAEWNAYNKHNSAALIFGNNLVVTVSDGAKLDLSSDGALNASSGTLWFYSGSPGGSTDSTFIVDNAEVSIVQNNTGNYYAPAIYFDRGDNRVEVTNGGNFYVYNAGNGTASYGSNNAAIQYNSGDGTFILDGKDSRAQIYADYGAALYGQRLNVSAGADTIFAMEGNTNYNTYLGAIVYSSSTLNFEMTSPKYFDFKNNRSGGGYLFYGNTSSIFKTTDSDLSLWETGIDLEGDPTLSWTLFDYRLTGGGTSTFNTVDTSSTTSQSFIDDFLGMTNYSRMSANNANAVIDELRVPTDADKYIYGHASVSEGFNDIRDAWTDEVYVTLNVKDESGDVVWTGEAVTSTEDVYDEGDQGGIFKIAYYPDGDGEPDFLPIGYTVEVVSAYRSSAGKIDGENVTEDNVHKSTEEDIQVSDVTVRDVTPPSPVVLDADSEVISTETTKISGASDETGATIYVKVNDSWVTNESGEVVTATVGDDNKWTFNLPTALEMDDEVAIYASDNAGPNEVSDVKEPPITSGVIADGVLGNINPDVDTAYHDAKGDEEFKARVVKTVIFSGSLKLTSAPDNISFGTMDISPLNQSYEVDSVDNALVVTDTRLTKVEWRVTAKLESELYNSAQDSTLKDALVYYYGTNKYILSDNSKAVVYEHSPTATSLESETVNLSNSWDEENGLQLEVKAGTAKVGTYEATIQWTIEDVPGQGD